MMLVDGDTSANANPAVNIPIAIVTLIAGLVAFTILARSGQKKMRDITDSIADRVQDETDLLRDRLSETENKTNTEEELREHLRE